LNVTAVDNSAVTPSLRETSPVERVTVMGRFNRFNFQKEIGAGDGIRTHDIQLGKLTLYP
jgi:hypothetical protein